MGALGAPWAQIGGDATQAMLFHRRGAASTGMLLERRGFSSDQYGNVGL
jgi:hypothetical protein